MSDRDLVHDLLARAAFAHDDDDPQGVAACFTPDGALEVWMRGDRESGSTTRGRDAIASYTAVSHSRKTCPRRHVLGTSRIEDTSHEGRAVIHRVRTYLQVWELPEGRPARLVSTATYHDEVAVDDGLALLLRRGIELDAAAFPDPTTDPNERGARP